MTITENILSAALKGDWSGIRAVHKSDLHAHAMLSAPFSTYQALSHNTIEPPPLRFSGFEHFDRYIFSQMIPHFQSLPARIKIVRDGLRHMRDDGVVVAELSFDLMTAVKLKISWADLAQALRPLLTEVRDTIRVSPELGIDRQINLPGWQEIAHEALQSGFFEGVDLYGNENGGVPPAFDAFFAEARSRGLRLKLHAGEQTSAAQMQADLGRVQPDAIQHGISAATDVDLMQRLAAQKIPLHLVPYGNYALSCVTAYERHPIRELFDAGVCVTINTDDFAVFGRSLSEEYVRLWEAGLFSAEELEVIRLNGLRQN